MEVGVDEVGMAVGEGAASGEAEVEDSEVGLGVEAEDGDMSHFGIPWRYYCLSHVSAIQSKASRFFNNSSLRRPQIQALSKIQVSNMSQFPNSTLQINIDSCP